MHQIGRRQGFGSAISVRLGSVVTIIAMLTVFASCGDDQPNRFKDQGDSIIESLDYVPPTAESKRKLLRCLARGGVSLYSRTRSGWRFHFPGILPAAEVGFAVLPSGGVMDLWLAVSRGAAKRAASLVNRRIKRNGQWQGHGVMARGKGIADVAIVPAPKVSSETHAIYACLESA